MNTQAKAAAQQVVCDAYINAGTEAPATEAERNLIIAARIPDGMKSDALRVVRMIAEDWRVLSITGEMLRAELELPRLDSFGNETNDIDPLEALYQRNRKESK